jgi:hypothetical protein
MISTILLFCLIIIIGNVFSKKLSFNLFSISMILFAASPFLIMLIAQSISNMNGKTINEANSVFGVLPWLVFFTVPAAIAISALKILLTRKKASSFESKVNPNDQFETKQNDYSNHVSEEKKNQNPNSLIGKIDKLLEINKPIDFIKILISYAVVFILQSVLDYIESNSLLLMLTSPLLSISMFIAWIIFSIKHIRRYFQNRNVTN